MSSYRALIRKDQLHFHFLIGVGFLLFNLEFNIYSESRKGFSLHGGNGIKFLLVAPMQNLKSTSCENNDEVIIIVETFH